MKHIGYIDGANTTPSTWKTHSLGMLAPHDLFIPNPGERENVDADRWRHVGWINPDKDGGWIMDSHVSAAVHGESRPAYIAATEPVPVFQDGPHVSGPKVVYNGGKTDPMDVRRSEFEALRKDAEDAHRRLDAMLETVNIAVQRVNDLKLDQPAPSKPSVIGSDDLIKEVLEFCTELDSFEGPDFDSDAEVCCQRANVYLLELARRLQSQTAPAEPPMTFYDHAFIAAYMAMPEHMPVDEATKRAHDAASHLTRNRANQP